MTTTAGRSLEGWLAVGLAGLALGLGAWNAWSLSSISGRLDAIEIVSEAPSAADRPSREDHWFAREPRADDGSAARYLARPDAGTAGTVGTDAGAVDVDDPAFTEKVATVMAAEEERRDAERRAMFEEHMRTEITAFATEEDLDDATTKALLAQMETRSEAFRAIRDDVREGVLGWSEARTEMEALGEEGEEEAIRLLGAERAERLETRLHGSRPGPGGWR